MSSIIRKLIRIMPIILLFLAILKKRAFTIDSKIKDDEVIERLRKITLRVDKLERMHADS